MKYMKILPCFLTSHSTAEDFDEDDGELQLIEEDDEPISEPRPAPLRSGKNTEPALIGQKALAFIVILLGAVITLPTVFIYLFKSPLPLQDVYTFGVSYYKLLFIFNLCAVMLVVSVVAFASSNYAVISATFIVSLFCSIPLIVGLRQDMTMQQAILDISFFSGWPFFIKPIFILTVLLLPAGVLFFVILQLKTVFSRQPHTYAFGGAALFLTITTFFSTYELSRAGQPTILTVFHHQAAPESPSAGAVVNQPGSIEASPVLPSVSAQERLSPEQKGQSQNTTASDAASQALAVPNEDLANPPSSSILRTYAPTTNTDSSALQNIEHKLGLLIGSLDDKVNSLTLLQVKAEEKRQSELTAINGRVEALSGKLDTLLLQLNNKAQNQGQPPEELVQPAVAEAGTAEAEAISVPVKTGQALANVNKQIDTLIEKVQAIETKTRDVP